MKGFETNGHNLGPAQNPLPMGSHPMVPQSQPGCPIAPPVSPLNAGAQCALFSDLKKEKLREK